MKSIILKTTKETVMINGDNVEQEFKTVELIKAAVNFTPPGGFDFTDMSNRLRILSFIDNANGAEELALEDSDYDNLRQYVKATKWGVVSRTILEFVNNLK